MAVRAGMGFGELKLSSAEAFWDWIDLLEDGGVNSYWQSDRVMISSAWSDRAPRPASGAPVAAQSGASFDPMPKAGNSRPPPDR